MVEIEGFEKYYGRILKAEYRSSLHLDRSWITRPDFYTSNNIHINMILHFDENYRLAHVEGDKCFSAYRGLYNRSMPVRPRKFTERDIRYLKKFILDITEEPQP